MTGGTGGTVKGSDERRLPPAVEAPAAGRAQRVQRVTTAQRRKQRWRKAETWKQSAQALLSGVIIIALWDLAVRIFDIPNYMLPLPWDVAASMIENRVQLLGESWVTLQESVLGYLLAIAVAVPIAVLVTFSKLAARLIYPAMVVSQVVPKVAVAPLFIIWLGFGVFPKVLMAFLVAFFAIVVSTAVGLNSIEPNMIHLARSMGASTLQTFWKVRLPNALPTFFGGLKVGVTLAVIGAIVGEFVGSGSGLGHLTVIAMGSLNLELVFACVVMMSLVGIFMYLAVEVVERLTVPWQRSARIEQIQATS